MMTDKESKSKIKEVKIDNDSIFSKEDVNTGHQPEFDYIKTLGVLMIVVSHLYIEFSIGYLLIILQDLGIIITAASLMFPMGVGMKYSRHHEIKDYVIRGITLLTLAQFFNLLRDCLPNLIAWWATGNNNFISRALLIVRGDILTFAGFAHLFMALLKKVNLSDASILIIGIIMNFIAYPLFKIMKFPSNFLLSQFLGYFIMTDAESYFPLFGYFVYVAFGNWIGGIYKKICNKDKFYNRIFIFCFPIVIIYHYFRKTNKIQIPIVPEYNSYEHYSLSPGPDAIHRLMSHMALLAIFYKIDKILGKTPYFIIHCGKNLNQYYIISYIITMQLNIFLKATRGDKYTSEIKNIDLLVVLISFSCRILIDMNDKYIHFTITTLKNPMRTIVFSLIWIVTIIMLFYIYPKVKVYATFWNNYLNDY